MTGNKNNLINYRRWSKGPTIRFAGGGSGSTKGYGDVNLGCITISGVLYVKNLKFNLFSMSQFADKGYFIEIKSDECKLVDFETKKVIMIARRSGGLYTVDWSSANVEKCLVSDHDCVVEKAWLWHKQTSHLNLKLLNKLSKKGTCSWIT